MTPVKFRTQYLSTGVVVGPIVAWAEPGAEFVVGCEGSATDQLLWAAPILGAQVDDLVDLLEATTKPPTMGSRRSNGPGGRRGVDADLVGADVDLDRGAGGRRVRAPISGGRPGEVDLGGVDLVMPTWGVADMVKSAGGCRLGQSTSTYNSWSTFLEEVDADLVVSRSTKLPVRRSYAEVRDSRPGGSGEADLGV
ncbi:unnamed protein product, partial [Closterium sp. NIES-53]